VTNIFERVLLNLLRIDENPSINISSSLILSGENVRNREMRMNGELKDPRLRVVNRHRIDANKKSIKNEDIDLCMAHV
jgi:hypothetical protein